MISLLTNDRTTAERKPYYDERDKAALRLMRKLRVDWSAGEDSFLLLCKVTIPNMFIIIRFVSGFYSQQRFLKTTSLLLCPGCW